MNVIAKDSPGAVFLLMGNEAIARGALEAGVRFAAAYPGNPSSEIMETLASVAGERGIYAEWSVNEKVALEAAAAASFAGVRAMASMKQNGVNVVSDFLTNLTLSGVKGGLLLISCDDPGGISSSNEEDARPMAALAEVPLLEPADPQEALTMTAYAFDLSERIKSLVMIRSTSRISHSRGPVRFGTLPGAPRVPHIDPTVVMNTLPVTVKHQAALDKLDAVGEEFEHAPFNTYEGPENPSLLVFACGAGYYYTREAVETLNLAEQVGVAKVGTTWPLPHKWICAQLRRSERVLFVEEVQPFLERNVKNVYAQNVRDIGLRTFYGKESGNVPSVGELNPDIALNTLRRLFDLHEEQATEVYRQKARKLAGELVPPREMGFCPGCPHRASFWSMKNVFKWDDREGFACGDIGCYSMAMWPTGFNQLKSVHAMGSGVGIASGYGKLNELGFDQPVVSVVGDSTFFHAGLPPLVNAVYNQSDFLLIILDNSATAMTGFQPHPGVGISARGEVTTTVDIESVVRSLGVPVEVADPYDLRATSQIMSKMLRERGGVRVLILRRKCALAQRREGGFPFRMEVDPEKCKGESCGCGRYCTRVFRCPGLIWDAKEGKSRIDQVICVGCGVCADICPENALLKEDVKHA